MIVRDHPALSDSRQCRLLSLGRSSLYYTPKGESAETLALMRRIDELFLKYPFYGARRMALHLRREGVWIGRRRAARLMRLMGLQAIYRAPRTSAPHPEHRVYPWLNSRIVCICDRLPGTSGGWVMDGKGFQVWLSAARGLTRAQRREALAVLSGRSEGEASKAAIELGVDEARRCPHCAREGAVSRGMARGLRRYQCKGCGRTFNALSGTPLSGLHHKERWLSFGASLAKGETVKASAARCDVAVSTAFRWRHRFLAAARSGSEVLKGIVEADETYVLESRKGARGLGRKARRRGGKAKKRGLSREQVPVLMAADRSGTTVSAVLPRVDAAALTAALDPVVAKDALLVSDGGASYPPCAAALGVSHEALNRSMGERVRGDLHVQTVNSRHSRLKDFLRPRRGIATRYLDNYLSWFHLVGLVPGANDRACLAAAVTR